ncbi:MAG: lysophospholipid acyltransferase family protein [Alphaproteobacteria bacterium]|nr:lysophospholipid acyltransferase family protein [Alphaproteobacteria bacterium]MBO6627898.1 lysophospholipid acyltransferase family protein [Alphaproteobacteria bacterium]MDF1625467.1 lysophospholipid acyltransferase family protein [Parvibaculaceae bacterium]
MSTFKSLSKKFVKSSFFQGFVAQAIASYVRLVHLTCRFNQQRSDIPERFWSADETFLCATWHGQNVILPPFWHNWRTLKVLVSKHGDGEIVARLVHNLGLSTIRGSGAPKEQLHKSKEKGGAAALRAMVRALQSDASVGLTADMPPGPARVAGLGIVMAARLSGRPIVPVATTTRGRIVLGNTWDRFMIPLPFTRGAVVWGEPIYIPRDLDEQGLEEWRVKVENALNQTTAEADALVGRLSGTARQSTPQEAGS